ncbi:MAG: citrate synthase [Chthoniobacterales bacterium]|nr:citrate synthase [Chthoniobacterales bacterium]
MQQKTALTIEGKTLELPVIVGTENEKAIDIRTLRDQTGYISFDDGYANTGSCRSDITFIDGEKGILRHRGYPIEELADKSIFLETAYLIIYGELPTTKQLSKFRGRVASSASVHEGMRNFFEGFPHNSHPMAILSAMLNTLGCYYPEMTTHKRSHDLEHFDWAAALLISKVRTLAAMSYRTKRGLPFVYPRWDLRYAANFLHMMFSEPYRDYNPKPEVTDALDLILLLHADHEQNCSTSTVRMVASSGANLFASVSAGVSALWGPLHGGANAAVVEMLEQIRESGDDGRKTVEAVKKGEMRLMGFGHRVYKNYDPRARILGETAKRVLAAMGMKDPLLDIAMHLEQVALNDDYFVSRKLYPNVDFYSGIILRAIGIPVDMFPVMFAIGRMPGWIAHWREMATSTKQKIHRPRQIYTGSPQRQYVEVEDRGD